MSTPAGRARGARPSQAHSLHAIRSKLMTNCPMPLLHCAEDLLAGGVLDPIRRTGTAMSCAEPGTRRVYASPSRYPSVDGPKSIRGDQAPARNISGGSVVSESRSLLGRRSGSEARVASEAGTDARSRAQSALERTSSAPSLCAQDRSECESCGGESFASLSMAGSSAFRHNDVDIRPSFGGSKRAGSRVSSCIASSVSRSSSQRLPIPAALRGRCDIRPSWGFGPALETITSEPHVFGQLEGTLGASASMSISQWMPDRRCPKGGGMTRCGIYFTH